MWHSILALANLGLALAYVFVALFIAPNVSVALGRTRVGGLLFFGMGALLHLELTLHTAFDNNGLTPGELVSWPLRLILIFQVIGAWLFVTGLYAELVPEAEREPSNDG